ncbi:MAG: hypothetical protein JNM80_02610 [Phycisphaerae bacterium]|nr:hypothetical protein [Phycisphaerae bacterium]
MGVWQEQVGSGILEPKRTFVLGTTRNDTGTYITLTRYALAGGAAEVSVTWPPTPTNDEYVGTLNEAKAMVVPVVPQQTTADNGRIYVAGTAEAGLATTDIVVLCYDFNLNLKWMRTYDYSPNPIFYGDDVPVAITTDQTGDPNYEGIEYSFVAVLGSSKGLDTGKDFVTLCYRSSDGCPLMPAKRLSSNGDHDDVPVDVVVGIATDPISQQGVPSIFVTGALPAAGNGTLPWFYTTAYTIPSTECLTAGQGNVALHWPRLFRGADTTNLPPNYVGVECLPARMKYVKGMLYLAGSALPIGFDITASRDMVYWVYLPTSPTTFPPASFDTWDAGNVLGEDVVTDLDVIFTGGGTFAAMTGWSRVGSTYKIATMMYNGISHGRIWDIGAIWDRQDGSGDDRGVRLQFIEASNEIANSACNLYVTGRSTKAGVGADYVYLKYDAIGTGANKGTAWTFAQTPFYNNATVNGNDIPIRLFAQHSQALGQGQSRFLIHTGTSAGGSSADDWATQFIIETRP